MRRSCPSEAELIAFHQGTLPEGEVEAVAEHLEGCPVCEAVLGCLDTATDPVVAALRRQAATGAPVPEGGDVLTRPERAEPEGWASVPDHEVLACLGRGGMGVVYMARQRRLNRLVALKRLRPGDAKELARARAEAESLARLRHPNIVQIHEVFEHQGAVYLVLEYVRHGSLTAKLRGQPQPARETAGLLETVARAVHYAHEHGIVHRDLKPANILLDAPGSPAAGLGVPKISDFGIAKQLATDSGATREGDIIGTPAYMAPEQAAGQVERAGPATDVYGLGVILYEMLTGRVPLQGPTVLDTLQLVRTQDPVPPRQLQPHVPRDLETICLKCLEKEPARRYASAEALADDLRRFQGGEPILARPAGRAERLLKWARRRPTAAALVACLFLAAAAAAAGGAVYNVRLRGERDRALHNLRVARGAIDKMLTEVAEEELNTEPRMEDKRRRLLEQALTYYKELLGEQSDDPELRRETALAQLRVGDILRLLGQHVRAEEAYAQAIPMLERLRDEFPADPEYRQRLAYAHNFRGEVFRLTSRSAEAAADYDAARALLEDLVARFPDAADYRSDLARTRGNQGIRLKDEGDPVAAEKEFNEAIALLAPLSGGRPAQRQQLARAYLNRATVLRAGGKLAEARDDCGQAIDLLRRLSSEEPRKPDYRYELAVAHANRGNALARLPAREGAEDDYRAALRQFRELAADFPSVPVYRVEQANTCNSLAALLAARQPERAKECWDEARRLLEQLVTDDPNQATYHGDLGITLGNVGRLRLKRGEQKEAAECLEKGVAELERALASAPGRSEYVEALRRARHTLETVRQP